MGEEQDPYEARVYATSVFEAAREYAEIYSEGIVLRTPLDGSWQESRSRDYVYASDTIEPERLDVLANDGSWHSLASIPPCRRRRVRSMIDGIKFVVPLASASRTALSAAACG